MSDFDPADYPEPDGYTLVPQDELDDMAAKAAKWDRVKALWVDACPDDHGGDDICGWWNEMDYYLR